MMRMRACSALLVVCASLFSHVVQADVTFDEEYGKRLKAYQTISPGGETPFGEQINLYTGELSFSQTDLAYEGNGPAIVINRTSVGTQKDRSTDLPDLGTWELSIPRIETLIWAQGSVDHSWGLSSDNYARCTNFTDVLTMDPEAWHGIDFITEDGAHHAMLDRVAEYSTSPTMTVDGQSLTFPAVTLDNWQFGCLNSTANQSITGVAADGEGFLAVSPNGTKYWLNYIVGKPTSTYREQDISGEWIRTHRMLAVMYVTRIEDRFGNAIDYHYTGDKLTSITGSDGRQVDIAWRTDAPLIQSVTQQPGSAAARTWQYQYTNITSTGALLSYVTLPDSSQWTFSGAFDALIAPIFPIDSLDSCALRSASNNTDATMHLTITAPSGVTGAFDLGLRNHARSYVPSACVQATTAEPTVEPKHEGIIPLFYSNSLAKRTISGPGLGTQAWTYTYPSTVVGSTTSDACASAGNCADTSYVDITDPEGNRIRHTFSTRAGAINPVRWVPDEGRQVQTDWYQGSGGTPLRTKTYRYAAYDQGPYPSRIGDSLSLLATNTVKLETWTPQDRTQITQQGVTFTHLVTAFDAFARPTSVNDGNTQNPFRATVTAYRDNVSGWVLGQVASSTVNGTLASQTTYGANDLPSQVKSFGRVQQTLTYYADGTLHTVADGNGNVTTLSAWKRGIPQSIQFPATPESPSGAGISAQVDDLGQIASVIDETGATTSYGYDSMGRVNHITYPTGDSTAWNATSISFVPVGGSEYGIGSGHWRQTISTGNARKVTYYDALWRPVLSREYDAGNVAGTTRYSTSSYDPLGRAVYTGYPVASTPTSSAGAWTLPGVRTTYDALGRVLTVKQDSELGVLTTTTAYLTGFQTRVTNPRSYVSTTTKYLAWDRPTTDYLLAIALPEGAFTDIVRDAFGKPTSITRHDAGTGVSALRRYFYNAYQELCRMTEPETSGNLMGYDAAGNLAWTASGLASSTACNSQGNTAEILARKVVRTYDARNRVTALSFPDGQSDTTYDYTPAGKLASVTALNGSSVPVTTQYAYNKRGLLLQERLLWNTIDWPVTYTYNANGHVTQENGVFGVSVPYAPNALGQPTQVGGYATGITYYPNGAVKQFTYGNGIVHTMTQNARGLPDRSRDVYGSTATLDDSYDYDANGNVAAISDALAGNRGNRDMTYDQLDRLKTATSKWFSSTGTTLGTASYAYDVLDNLTQVSVPASPTAAARNHYYCYDPSWRLTNLKTGSCSGTTVTGLGYDVQGNLANKNGVAYAFDMGNRLRNVTDPAKPYMYYTYDGQGRRVRDVVGGVPKYSLYSLDGRLTYTHDVRANVQSWYLYLAGSLVAIRERNMTSGAVTDKYQHTDALGSPVAVTSATRAELERSEYEPYGRLLNRALTDGPGYTGHVSDAATGLSYMQQRYYDPGIGRFLSVDPVSANSGPGFNRYSYAANNPYRYYDPDGRRTKSASSSGDGCDIECKRRKQEERREKADSPFGGARLRYSSNNALARYKGAKAELKKLLPTLTSHESSTEEGAATYFDYLVQPISTKYTLEIIASIIGNSGSFRLTDIVIGHRFDLQGVGYTVNNQSGIGVTTVHTHPFQYPVTRWYQPFSPNDIDFAKSVDATIFVTVPDGSVYRYSPGGFVDKVER